MINKSAFVTLNNPLNLDQLFVYNSLLHHFTELNQKYRFQRTQLEIGVYIQMKIIAKTLIRLPLRTYILLHLKTMFTNESAIKIKSRNWIFGLEKR